MFEYKPVRQTDLTQAFEDIDKDGVLNQLSPILLLENFVEISNYPLAPYVAFRIGMNDTDLRYTMVPTRSRWMQSLIYCFLAAAPLLTGSLDISLYLYVFYAVKFNRVGSSPQSP